MNAVKWLRFILSLFLVVGAGVAEDEPAGGGIERRTYSPDQRFGYFVHEWRTQVADGVGLWADFVLVRLRDGKRVLKLDLDNGDPSRGGFSCCWSKDSGTCVCSYAAKWGPWDVQAVAIHADGSASQRGIMKEIQRAILRRLKKTRPEAYAAAVEANRGNGEAYPDGFTFDVIFSPADAHGSVDFVATVAADPKFAKRGDQQLDALLEVRVLPSLKLSYGEFQSYDGSKPAEVRRAREDAVVAEEKICRKIIAKLFGQELEDFQKEERAWYDSLDVEPSGGSASRIGTWLRNDIAARRDRTKVLRSLVLREEKGGR